MKKGVRKGEWLIDVGSGTRRKVMWLWGGRIGVEGGIGPDEIEVADADADGVEGVIVIAITNDSWLIRPDGYWLRVQRLMKRL